jgi:hypothetical protein
MKRGAAPILAILIVTLGGSSNAMSWPGNGNPLKYISSCELDLNNDGESDVVLLVETLRGRELIVLMKTNAGYDAYEVAKANPSMHLSCHFGNAVKETDAGKKEGDKGRVYKTPGTYIQLSQPEGSAVAYFWNGRGFTEVWTAD